MGKVGYMKLFVDSELKCGGRVGYRKLCVDIDINCD